MITDSRLAFLRAARMFKGLGDDVLQSLAEVAEEQEIPGDQFLFRQGDAPTDLLLVMRGAVALAATAGGKRATLIDIATSGEPLAFAAVLAGAPSLLSAYALGSAQVLRIGVAALWLLASRTPSLALALAQEQARLYRSMIEQLTDLKLRTAAQRLAAHLLKSPRLNTGADVRLAIGKRLLASQLGMRPEHLSRAFAILADHGVTTRGARVSIVDRAQTCGLRRFGARGSGCICRGHAPTSPVRTAEANPKRPGAEFGWPQLRRRSCLRSWSSPGRAPASGEPPRARLVRARR